MRILAPKVHVEIFRPTQLVKTTEAGNISTVRINPRLKPNELRYIKSTNIEDRRIKGIQFEETALFGGFIEINIAEDPRSELFDRFLPNDHVEVFFDDVVKYGDTNEKHLDYRLDIENEYKFSDRIPKFQGATWKSDLIYRASNITTQIHAWDYLRILQYINIPRGERKEKTYSTVVEPDTNKKTNSINLKVTQQRLKYGDDMLDYIDSAVSAFTENSSGVSIFGQKQILLETTSDDTPMGIMFTPTVYNVANNRRNEIKPLLTLYNGGIGEYCHKKLRDTNSFYSKFKEIYSRTNLTWEERGIPYLESPEQIIEHVGEAINSMERYDILQFRFLDGAFSRFKGFDKENNPIDEGEVEYVADIIAISQFALIELLLKKLTIDHKINLWFTPVLRFDTDFLKGVEALGSELGKATSKLIYIRFREVNNSNESTVFTFNMDTYPFVEKYSTEAFKLAIGNFVKNNKDEISSSWTDIFSEILTTVDFPQQALKNDEKFYSVYTLAEKTVGAISANTPIKSQKDLFDDLMERFTNNFSVSQEFENSSDPTFYIQLMQRVTNYSSLIQKVLAMDDKIISYIREVPASYMRADIYTGSKFNTIQYDSLAITRIIQLIASNMAGFPSTNNPASNTEKGKIDSYPIFAANRIVIRPKAYFGIRNISEERTTSEFFYDLYPSLSELFIKKGYEKEGDAVCFLFLDIAKKKLKEADKLPEFIFPIEDIQDFGIIKANTVNHYFNFSLADSWRDYSLISNLELSDIDRNDPNADIYHIYKNTAENGLFIEYRESGLSSIGFSPPEHEHLKLEDLTQNRSYKSWSSRFTPNTSVNYINGSDKPIFNPRIAYIQNQNKNNKPIQQNHYLINNYDDYKNPLEVILTKISKSSSLLVYADSNGDPTSIPVENIDITIQPFYGITAYVDISDLKAEYKALKLILNSETLQYSDIINVDLELMQNLKIKTPLKFKINKDAERYQDRITFIRAGSGSVRPKHFEEESVLKVITDINTELDKIKETDMMWLFPYSGYTINEMNGSLIPLELDKGSAVSLNAWRKHLFLLSYLDLLIKGTRYIIWNMAKSRNFCHVYLPIEYKKYSQYSAPDLNYEIEILEPGSSVQISYDESKNSLFKTINEPMVSFPINALEKGEKEYRPLFRSISRGTEFVGSQREINNLTDTREMTWYVSKKVTYIGEDTGAMMRVEMTEGSLDWTLFYNEENLLTQVSEHYLLNGLGNFRTGIF